MIIHLRIGRNWRHEKKLRAKQSLLDCSMKENQTKEGIGKTLDTTYTVDVTSRVCNPTEDMNNGDLYGGEIQGIFTSLQGFRLEGNLNPELGTSSSSLSSNQ